MARELFQRREFDCTPAFVGREHELTILSSEVRRALTGIGGSILLSGEPGIGKTRTAEQLAIIARDCGASVVFARGWEGGGAPAFWLWAQVVRTLVHKEGAEKVVSRLGPGGTDLIQHMPVLRELVAKQSDGSDKNYLETDEVRFILFDSIVKLLKNTSEATPLTLVLDDLHVADTQSLVFLNHLAQEIRGSPLLVIGTYRDNEVDISHPAARPIASLIRYSFGRHVPLRGLGKSEIASFLRAATGGDVFADLVDAVFDKSEGNPFFVAELVKLLTAEGYRWAQSSALQIPATVKDVVRRRLRRLSQSAQELVSVASVIGREFDLSVLTSVMDLSATQVLPLLDEATSVRIICEISEDFCRYRFTHILIRDTLYEDLPKTRRVQLHAELATKLEQMLADEADSHLPLLAHHFVRAVPCVDEGRASKFAVRAGKLARDVLAYEEAASYYIKALELLPRDRESLSERCEILLSLGEAQSRAGDWLGARKTYATAGSCAKTLGLADAFAMAAAGFKGLIPGKSPPDEEAIAMMREALMLLGAEESIARARTLSELAKALYFSSDQQEATSYSVEAVAIGRKLGDDLTLGNALEARMYSLWCPSKIREALEVAGEVIDVSRASGDRELHCRGLVFRYACFLELGDRELSRASLEAADVLSQELKNPRYLWQVALAQSSESFLRGDYKNSSELSEEAFRSGIRVHDPSATHYKVLADFRFQKVLGGFTPTLEEVISAAARCYPEIAIYRIGLAIVRHRSGSVYERTALCSDEIRSLLDNIPENALELISLSLLAEICAGAGETACASVIYNRLKPYAMHTIVASWGAACDGSVSHYLGLLAGALERWDHAVRHFEDALEMNRRMGFVPFVARTQHYYAATLLRRGRSEDRDHAVQLLSEAITTYQRLGMNGYLPDALKLAEDVPELACLREASSDAGTATRMNEKAIKVDSETADVVASDETVEVERDIPQTNLFRREGEYWTVRYRGRIVRLKNMRGLQYIAFLLGQPGREFHALDLSALIHPGFSSVSVRESVNPLSKDDRLRIARLGDAGPVLDAKSRARYRSRLKALGREVTEAEQLNDILKAAAARKEMEMLARELSSGSRLDGGSRVAGSYAERARINVRNNISTALRAIRRHDEELWRHLYRGVRTGTYCAYIPEAGVDWQV